MYAYISILMLKFGLIYSNILEVEKNFDNPKLERNNILNKGVWFKNRYGENLFDKSSVGNFLFKPNSLDVDYIQQNSFDTIGTNSMQDKPFFSTYVDRTKRSTNHKRKRRPRKSMKNCKNKIDCVKTLSKEDKIDLIGSKLVTDLKPSLIYNDYPYEVSVLLNDLKKVENNNQTERKESNNSKINVTKLIKEANKDTTDDKREATEGKYDTKGDLRNIVTEKGALMNSVNNTSHNDMIPKRNKKQDYYNDEIKNINFVEDFNKTDGKYSVFKMDRDIFDEQKSWNVNEYAHDSNVFKIVPKVDIVTERNKPITERGLIKVISMLTKTFKKVMKHHNEVKDIHEKLITMNNDFVKNIASINEKLQSFEEKYSIIMKFDEKLKDFDKYLKSKEDYFRQKQQEMSDNLLDFEKQQKNFLNQQRQFFKIQTLMLGHIEKINIKQNLIAKTQSEISQRQNNFARILKKAKQLYLEAKSPVSRLNTNIAKPKDYVQKIVTTTPLPVTESIKINLFSIPAESNKLEIHDDLIIKEKDQQPVDDLVYKYYFNNTFIDNLIKSKIFNNVLASPDQIYTRSKNKRNGPETTLLLPVNDAKDTNRLKRSAVDDVLSNITSSEPKLSSYVPSIHSESLNASSDTLNLNISMLPIKRATRNSLSLNKELTKSKNIKSIPQLRHKRWINNSKTNNKHRHGKSHYLNGNHKKINLVAVEYSLKNVNESADVNATNPFVKMATKFCFEIGQNVSEQAFSWCVEKTLRRLHILDTKLLPTSPTVVTEKQIEEEKATTKPDASANIVTIPIKILTAGEGVKITASPTLGITPAYTVISEASYQSPMFQVPKGQQIFFPGNEELESNLKQFDLSPDPEGNFYYDGSLHASDIIPGPDSGGNSDILPGFESNSHMEVDPYTIYLQAMRRASVRNINKNVLRNMKIY